VPTNRRWLTQSVSYQEALSVTETKVSSMKNQMRVATETGNGSLATVCYQFNSSNTINAKWA